MDDIRLEGRVWQTDADHFERSALGVEAGSFLYF